MAASWAAVVLKVSEYRKHAAECRKLGAGLDAQHLVQVQEMARTWEQLAAERAKLIRRHPELALKGEYDEIDQTKPQGRSAADGTTINAPGHDGIVCDDEAAGPGVDRR